MLLVGHAGRHVASSFDLVETIGPVARLPYTAILRRTISRVSKVSRIVPRIPLIGLMERGVVPLPQTFGLRWPLHFLSKKVPFFPRPRR